MKKAFSFWLISALTCGMAMSVASCKDDDNENLSPEEQAQKEQTEQNEAATRFWNVVGQLVGIDQATDDYATKTFAPTIGEAKGGNETVRRVLVNSEESAAQSFCSLVGLDESNVTTETTSYTWQDDAVGTLTYNKSTDGKALATVDVNIPQVPGLRQIEYLTPEQEGTNGSKFKGTAYYRFGDVVKKVYRDNDDGGKQKTEYWVCVRPAFGPEGKKESHWITVSPLPKKHIYSYYSKNSKYTYQLPTKIGVNKKQMDNLAEMLYAMAQPEKWQDNITDHSSVNFLGSPKGLPIFQDFHSTNIKYHNQYFWQMVRAAWEDKKVAETAFGCSMKGLMGNASEGLLFFLTDGYSWPWGNTLTLHQYQYTSGKKAEELNMHKSVYTKPSKNVINPLIELSLANCSDETPFFLIREFFDDLYPHFILRHATGTELNGGIEPSVYTALGAPGLSDFYRYNDYYGIPSNVNEEPQVLTSAPNNDKSKQKLDTEFEGEPHYKYYDIYIDEEGNKWMPIYCSGSKWQSVNEKVSLDMAPVTYLVSFQGLKVSADKQRITNLPGHDLAMKSALWLWVVSNNFRNISDGEFEKNIWGRKGLTTIENMDVDMRQFLLGVAPPQAKDENEGKGASVLLACVGYDDGDNSTGQQKLIRFYDYPDNRPSLSHAPERQPKFYIWDRYPKVASKDFPWPVAFSKDPIYLQDVAIQDFVTMRAEDPFVYGAIEDPNNKNWADASTRAPRTEADPRAKDITNYIYDRATWKKGTQPLSMWREPVLLYRVDVVYDRGDSDYATLTINGHHLRPYFINEWIDDDGDERFNADVRPSINLTLVEAMVDFHLNGQNVSPSSWKDDYKTK